MPTAGEAFAVGKSGPEFCCAMVDRAAACFDCHADLADLIVFPMRCGESYQQVCLDRMPWTDPTSRLVHFHPGSLAVAQDL
jgi:hypothetical protein